MLRCAHRPLGVATRAWCAVVEVASCAVRCSSSYTADVMQPLRAEVLGDATKSLQAADEFVARGKAALVLLAFQELGVALFVRMGDAVLQVRESTTVFSDLAKIIVALPLAIAWALIQPLIAVAVAVAHAQMAVVAQFGYWAQFLAIYSVAAIIEVSACAIGWSATTSCNLVVRSVRRTGTLVRETFPNVQFGIEKDMSPIKHVLFTVVPRSSVRAAYSGITSVASITAAAVSTSARVSHSFYVGAASIVKGCRVSVGQAMRGLLQVARIGLSAAASFYGGIVRVSFPAFDAAVRSSVRVVLSGYRGCKGVARTSVGACGKIVHSFYGLLRGVHRILKRGEILVQNAPKIKAH